MLDHGDPSGQGLLQPRPRRRAAPPPTPPSRTRTRRSSARPAPSTSSATGWRRCTSTSVTWEYFGALARATDDDVRPGHPADAQGADPQRSLERAARRWWWRARTTRGCTRRCCGPRRAFVIEDAGYKENVIPSTAHVRVNCRGIPGGQKPRAFLARSRSSSPTRTSTSACERRGSREAEYLDALDETWATPARRPRHHRSTRRSAGGSQDLPGRGVRARRCSRRGPASDPWREQGIPGLRRLPLRHRQRPAGRACTATTSASPSTRSRKGTDFMIAPSSGCAAHGADGHPAPAARRSPACLQVPGRTR